MADKDRSVQKSPVWRNPEAFADDFAAFCDRFTHLFARSEPREKAFQYIRSLMSTIERRNGWQLAEAMGDVSPHATQRLLYLAKWSARKACDLLEDYIVEEFGAPQGICVLDDTGFNKKGKRSVGVTHQYNSATGKIENCQVGVFLAYATNRDHVLLDRRLYLPKAWCEDEERRNRAHIPSRVQFRTKSELGLRMLRRAWRRGVPMAWITGAETYGEDPKLRAAIDAEGKHYVLAVTRSMPVGLMHPKGPSSVSTVAQLIAALPASHWRRLDNYDWLRMRVTESRGQLRAGELWLLARRSRSNPSQTTYYLSNAGETTPIETLIRVASSRHTIERCFQQAKDELGFDQYEVRTWQSWHRHITLSMMALAWLASVRSKQTRASSKMRSLMDNSALLPGFKPPEPSFDIFHSMATAMALPLPF